MTGEKPVALSDVRMIGGLPLRFVSAPSSVIVALNVFSGRNILHQKLAHLLKFKTMKGLKRTQGDDGSRSTPWALKSGV